MNPDPNIRSSTPADTTVGAKLVITAGTVVTLRLNAADPPPGPSLVTSPDSVPASATCPAATSTSTVSGVIRAFSPVPPNVTRVAGMNPCPSSISTNPADPASTDTGSNPVITGTGFASTVTSKASSRLVPAPGFVTLTAYIPGSRSVPGINTRNWFADESNGECSLSPKFTMLPAVKLPPFSVTTSSGSSEAVLSGVIDRSVGLW